MSIHRVALNEPDPSLDGVWFYDSVNGALRSDDIDDSESTTLTINPFAGAAAGHSAARVIINTRVSSEGNYDKLFISGPGYQQNYSGEQDWVESSFVISDGEVITLEYRKDTSSSKGDDSAFINLIEYRYGSEVPAEITDDNYSGDWYFDINEGAYRSANIGHDKTSSMHLDLKGMGVNDLVLAILEVRASMEENADNLVISHDEGDIEVTGDSGWVRVAVAVPEDGVITLSYVKDSSVTRYLDAAFIKAVYLVDGGLEAEPVAFFSIGAQGGLPALGFNPFASPRVPNPSAISASGLSLIRVVIGSASGLGAIDQIDGSGANGTPTGGVSDPARMGVIAGTVLDIQAQPVSRRVRVHERATGRIVRETWSDADGKYRFTDLDPRRAFYVMAFDHTLQQNAVVSDNVHSEVEDSP